MVDIFGTHTLAKVVEHLDMPAAFLLNRYFTQVQEDESEEIHFDIDESKPRLTPFVHPTRAGRVVDDHGFETKTFKPAYAKDKRRFDPSRPLKRRQGERIGGTMSAMERRQAQIGVTLADQLEMLTRREEVMAAEALLTGKVTVTGDDYPTVVVDFQRDAALTGTLAPGSQWGEAGVKPLDDIEDWSNLVLEKSGAPALDVIMDPKAARKFRSDPEVKDLLDNRRGGNEANLSLAPKPRGQGREKARFMGTIEQFNFWVYQDRYVDEADVMQQMLPDNTVIMASDMWLEGVRAYGAILDEKADYRATRFFAKSWLEEDPAVRWMLLQSAPLVVPYRPNASLARTVA